MFSSSRTRNGRNCRPGKRQGSDGSAEGPTNPIAGSVAFATSMERRRFLRHIANTLFYGGAAMAVGRNFKFLLDNPGARSGDPETTGACCPIGCGPSPCCSTTCCSKNCCTGGKDHDTCIDNGTDCLGKTTEAYSTGGCWVHVYTSQLGTAVRCCDCKTNNQTGCSNPIGANRCICYNEGRILKPHTLVGSTVA